MKIIVIFGRDADEGNGYPTESPSFLLRHLLSRNPGLTFPLLLRSSSSAPIVAVWEERYVFIMWVPHSRNPGIFTWVDPTH